VVVFGEYDDLSCDSGEAMRRREFIVLVGGAAAWPFATSAQQAKAPRIGYLATGSLESADARLGLDAFRQ
jgi:hypothetical protein